VVMSRELHEELAEHAAAAQSLGAVHLKGFSDDVEPFVVQVCQRAA
jgi:hypothetical protein